MVSPGKFRCSGFRCLCYHRTSSNNKQRQYQDFYGQNQPADHFRQQKNAQDLKKNIFSVLSFVSSANLFCSGPSPELILYFNCPVVPEILPTIIYHPFAYLYSDFLYITDCTLKRNNNQGGIIVTVPARTSNILHGHNQPRLL